MWPVMPDPAPLGVLVVEGRRQRCIVTSGLDEASGRPARRQAVADDDRQPRRHCALDEGADADGELGLVDEIRDENEVGVGEIREAIHHRGRDVAGDTIQRRIQRNRRHGKRIDVDRLDAGGSGLCRGDRAMPEPAPTSAMRNPRTSSGVSRTWRAMACPPGQAKAQ